MLGSHRIDNIMIGIAIAGVVAALTAIFGYAPLEETQGEVQKIFYIHLASVAAMYILLFVGVVFAIAYLAAKKIWCDRISYACNEVGWLFITAVLVTGSIWAKPIWGTWWTWDARLTTTLLVWLIYTAYLLLRSQSRDLPQWRRYSAIVAIIGFLDIPLIHYSVTLFRGIHPRVITTGGITAEMAIALVVSIIGILALASTLVYLRYHISWSEEKV